MPSARLPEPAPTILIDRDGKVYQMVPEVVGALHANCNATRSNCLPSCPICDGKDGALTEPYSRSIGIELVNRGHIPPRGRRELFIRTICAPSATTRTGRSIRMPRLPR